MSEALEPVSWPADAFPSRWFPLVVWMVAPSMEGPREGEAFLSKARTSSSPYKALDNRVRFQVRMHLLDADSHSQAQQATGFALTQRIYPLSREKGLKLQFFLKV